MHIQVVMAGFGGQGLMLIGKLLAEASMEEGKEVSWLPSYGPEMRGGTANCTVVVSDEPVASPVINNPDALVAMNLPSLDKFSPMIKPGGLIVINSSLIPKKSGRDDVRELMVEGTDIANELGTSKAANMVMLGAFVGASGICRLETIDGWMSHQFKTKTEVVELNRKALQKGLEIGKAIEVKA
ncbi:MAG TPA: 2-oxoacid:acceptor oxidoreductase family protein [bacterium]|jgi:2-oxoglutarate ferredoxin oxidoreductase subunit gamma